MLNSDSSKANVRRAVATDIPPLLLLMRELAAFEHYLDQFAIDEVALNEAAFGSTPLCHIWVAEQQQKLCAYAVCYWIHFTFDRRPTLVLKELFVASSQRGAGVGQRLMQAVAEFAVQHNAPRLKWDVMRGNEAAEHFYQALGAAPDHKWINYQMPESTLRQLAAKSRE